MSDKGNLIQKQGMVEFFFGGGQPYKSEGSFGEVKITGDQYVVY